MKHQDPLGHPQSGAIIKPLETGGGEKEGWEKANNSPNFTSLYREFNVTTQNRNIAAAGVHCSLLTLNPANLSCKALADNTPDIILGIPIEPLVLADASRYIRPSKHF